MRAFVDLGFCPTYLSRLHEMESPNVPLPFPSRLIRLIAPNRAGVRADTLTVRSGQNEGREKRREKGKRRGRKRKLHPILTHNLRNEGKMHTAQRAAHRENIYISSYYHI